MTKKIKVRKIETSIPCEISTSSIDITINKVKDINFSATKDIIILLQDGIVILNGKKI